MACCAGFNFSGKSYILLFIMLFWPLLDRHWQIPKFPRTSINYLTWIILIIFSAALLAWQPDQAVFAVVTLTTAAFPEEWFFRAYLMESLGKDWRTNIIASLIFSAIHGLAAGWTVAVLVFAPSLFYGWLYQRTRDLPLLVLTHALSNIVFALFLAKPMSAQFGYLLGYQG